MTEMKFALDADIAPVHIQARYSSRRWWEFWKRPTLKMRNLTITLYNTSVHFDADLASRANWVKDSEFVLVRGNGEGGGGPMTDLLL